MRSDLFSQSCSQTCLSGVTELPESELIWVPAAVSTQLNLFQKHFLSQIVHHPVPKAKSVSLYCFVTASSHPHAGNYCCVTHQPELSADYNLLAVPVELPSSGFPSPLTWGILVTHGGAW